MQLSNQQKYILEILKEFKYLRVRQLYALVRTHYRAQGIEINERRMDIMLRQLRTGTNYVWLRGDVVSYGDRKADSRLLEALDVMLELTKAQPGFFSKDELREPFLLRFTGNDKGAGFLFSVAWLDAATHVAAIPRMKGEPDHLDFRWRFSWRTGSAPAPLFCRSSGGWHPSFFWLQRAGKNITL